MAKIQVSADEVTVDLSGLEKVGGLSGNLHIPRTAITSARYCEDLFAEKRGLRVAGTSIPGRIRLGRFITSGATDFLAIHGTPTGVVLELSNYRYTRVLVSLPEDEARKVVAEL